MAEKDFTYASFYQYLTEGKLMGTRCPCTGQAQFPPRPYCPDCAPDAIQWTELGNKGKLLAFTVIYVGTTQMLNAGFDRNKPYCVGIVQLDDGPAISAFILGVDTQKPETIIIGAPVIADFVELGPEGAKKTVLAFRLL